MSIKLRTTSYSFASETPSSEPRTYIVLGAPRGGTSLIAGALRIAGIYMGDNIDSSNNEDLSFTIHKGNVGLFRQSNSYKNFIKSVRNTIKIRNEKYPVWGWKDPVCANYIEDVLPEIRNPHFIVVTRDVTAVSIRERAELPKSEIDKSNSLFNLDKSEEALDLYKMGYATVRKHGRPALFFSYERAIRYPAEFSVKIVDFTGMTVGKPKERREIINQIAAYTRPDAVSADIDMNAAGYGSAHNSAAEIIGIMSSLDNIDQVYEFCAKTLNSGGYNDAMECTTWAIGLIGEKFVSVPHLAAPPKDVLSILAGLHYMRSLARLNTGLVIDAKLDIVQYCAIVEMQARMGIESELVRALVEPAKSLEELINARFE